MGKKIHYLNGQVTLWYDIYNETVSNFKKIRDWNDFD